MAHSLAAALLLVAGVIAQPSYRQEQLLARSQPAMRAALERRLRARLAGVPQDHHARLALGLLARDRGGPEAESLLRAAAEGMHRTRDRAAEADALDALVTLLGAQRRLAECEEALGQAARAAEESGDRERRLVVRVREAALALRRFENDRAWALLKEVEPAVFPSASARVQAVTLSTMGWAASALGRHADAREYYQRQLAIARAQGDRYEEASALFDVSSEASRTVRGFNAESDDFADQALAAAVQSGNAAVEAMVHGYWAQRPDPKRSPQWKIERLRRALVIFRRLGATGDICFTLREIARWLSVLPGHEREALALTDEAIRRARASGDRFHVARGMLRRWMLAADHLPRDEAVAAGLQALDAIEAVRALQRDEEARARVMAEWVFVYQQLIGYLLKPRPGQPGPLDADVDLAFQVTERLRAQELLAALDAAGSTPLLAGGRPEHAERAALLEQIARTQQRLLDVALAPADRAALLRELEGLEVRERALRGRLASADRGFAEARSPLLATAGEARRALAPDEALLSYVLRQRPTGYANASEQPKVFVLTRDAMRVVPLGDDVGDPQVAAAALAGLAARRDGTERDGAARLYASLLRDALAQLPPTVTRLVIVPDGALHRVPFDALRAAADAPPVAARYEVTVVPSASLWLRLRSRVKPASGSLLALADPRWNAEDAVAIARQATLWQGLALGALPRGRREARLALRSLDGAGLVLAGAEATERALKQADFRRYAVLHLAAHAVVDDQYPERSAIVLAPGAAEEDGLLQAREIVGLDLSGLVIVLSACSSSTGEVLAGEGPLSLARAFLQAGARAVVGNLWEVRDDEAEALMNPFYRELGRGRSVAAALAAARRERIRAGAPVAAWAGTVILGDGTATVAAAGHRPASYAAEWAGAGLVAVGLLASLAVWWRRRRRPTAF